MVNIKKVVVLMLENRSFDHMLGNLKSLNPEINGCLPGGGNKACSNPGSSGDVEVTLNAVYSSADPSHSVSATSAQIYNSDPATNFPTTPPTMKGFVHNFATVMKNDTIGAKIMDCFDHVNVQAISNLSMEFALFDGYFASVPGPTMVNRAYAASATSHGMSTNDPLTIGLGLPQKTMFTQLLDMGLDYRVYFDDFPSLLAFKELRREHTLPRFSRMAKFYKDVASDTLPQLSWLEPGYFDVFDKPASDQHPNHDVSLGDKMIGDVYTALRSSTSWNETAFIITYDEHGGFFDHVPPPTENVPNPDSLNNTLNDPFNFTRLGVRVPMIVVSPLVEKGSVVHAAPSSAGQYEHSSIIATVIHKIFEPKVGHPPPSFLTSRDEWAKTFEDVFSLSEPRTDCPESVPDMPSHRASHPEAGLPKLEDIGKTPVTNLQKEFVAIASGLHVENKCEADPIMTELIQLDHPRINSYTEEQAFQYVKTRLNDCLDL